MKNMTIAAVIILFLGSACEKDHFKVNQPDVDQFVRQIKNGTYNQFERGDKGETLWAIMPVFQKEHIPELIRLASDTSLVCPCNHFPTNPISSIYPYRIHDGQSCIMVAEYLLWCVEGVLSENTFGSLVPILIKEGNDEGVRLNGKEILEVRKIYHEWWESSRDLAEFESNPLEGSLFWWR